MATKLLYGSGAADQATYDGLTGVELKLLLFQMEPPDEGPATEP